MANTYTQIHIHIIFAVKDRSSLIKKEWRNDLYRQIGAAVHSYGHKLISIGGIEDHVHMLIGFRPNESLSDLVRDVKRSSSIWINQQGFVRRGFSWQAGYGAFSYSKCQVREVCGYIGSQEEHHRKKTFMEEYMELLKEFEVEYDRKYVFHDLSDGDDIKTIE